MSGPLGKQTYTLPVGTSGAGHFPPFWMVACRAPKRPSFAERDGQAARLAEQEARIAAGGAQLDEARSRIAGLEGAIAAAQSQVLAQSKAMSEIFGRMDALQGAITAGPASPGRKTSGKARRKTAQAKSPRTRAAKTVR
jgi:hypothetical protein